MFNVSGKFLREFFEKSSHSWPAKIFKVLYTEVVEPLVRNFSFGWSCAGKTEIDKLRKLKNHAVRILTNSSFDTQSKPLIKMLGLKTTVELFRE